MMSSKSWSLFAAPLGILLLGLGVLFLKQHSNGVFSLPQVAQELGYLPWLLAAILLAVFIQAMLLHSRPQPDTWLFPCAMLLSSVGIVMIARLKPALLVPQIRWVIIGMLVFLAMLRMGNILKKVTQYQYLIGLACIFLLCLPIFLGTEIGGSRNWLLLGPFRVQPSEFGKILLVFFLSAYLSDHRQVLSLPNFRLFFLQLPPLRFIAPLLLIWGIAILMFVVQKDLGAALLFFGIAVLMTYMATGNKSYVFIALLFFGVAAAVSYALFGHVRVRFDIWLNPWQDPSGMAYQVVQSMFSFGSGGIWGTGFAHGHPELIPEVHTDFIFAAVAEELGLIGSLLLMLVYALFFYEGIQIALGCREEGQIFLVAGCDIVFFLQAFIIIAGVTKFLPLTGITLPFVSYGGSSIVSCFILLGVMVSLSRKERNAHG